jgi:hypothetical protein
MKTEFTFISELKAIHAKNLIEQLRADDRPGFFTFWNLKNEIKPVDLYCYLFARFGSPSGIQNFLRGDHSDNLIHWEWALQYKDRILLIQGQNYRTNLWVSGNELPPKALKDLDSELKSDFSEYGPKN